MDALFDAAKKITPPGMTMSFNLHRVKRSNGLKEYMFAFLRLFGRLGLFAVRGCGCAFGSFPCHFFVLCVLIRKTKHYVVWATLSN